MARCMWNSGSLSPEDHSFQINPVTTFLATTTTVSVLQQSHIATTAPIQPSSYSQIKNRRWAFETYIIILQLSDRRFLMLVLLRWTTNLELLKPLPSMCCECDSYIITLFLLMYIVQQQTLSFWSRPQLPANCQVPCSLPLLQLKEGVTDDGDCFEVLVYCDQVCFAGQTTWQNLSIQH